MAFVDPTDSVIAITTNAGRDIVANSVLGFLSFQLLGFKVGRAGYDTLNPVHITPPDPAAVDLADPVFPVPTSDLAPFVQLETPFPNVVAPVCRLDQSQALYGLGELGIWVQILRNAGGPGPYTVGSTWLFALAHYPFMGKTSSHVFVLRLLINT